MSNDIKLFWKYVGPSIIGMLIAGSFSIVDTIFIGQGMGKVGLSAVALTWPLIMLIGAVGQLFSAGAGVLISQARGMGNEDLAQKSFGNMITLMLISSIFLGGALYLFLEPILITFGASQELLPDALAYAKVMLCGSLIYMFMGGCLEVVRNDGRPMLAMWLLIIGLLGNIVLDYLFIMVLKWGAAGAATATVISQGIATICGIIYFLSPKTKLKISVHNLTLRWKNVRNISITGFPIFGNMLSILAMLFMHNWQSLRYGEVDGLAAYTVVAALESLGSILMTGLAGGMQPLVAHMYGAGKYRRQNRFGNYAYWAAFLAGIGLMIFSFLLRNIMPDWMGLSGSVAELASHGIFLSASAFILLGVIRVAGFYYQSTGKIFDSSLLVYGDAFFALPICLFILPIWFGMDGVWLAMPLSRVILFFILLYLWFGKGRRGVTKYAKR